MLRSTLGDVAHEETLVDVKRGISDTDQRFQWQSYLGEDKPLYIGIAPHGTATSANTWVIQRYTFVTGPNGSGVPALIETKVGAWDDRGTLF